MHPADLNRFTETTGVCWSYWSDDLEGAGRVGSYIFMRGNQPVQSIDWDKTDRWPLADTDDSRLSI
ncbi:hypothetical protein GS4_18_00810 [Gordonia soli NBRC 108243]|uniref:Uncharacterized protein n=2 Tax=Gordonia soli TaxID=320799 RepID=M0QJR3_9ACTN|nr:hypothetical protein GS4_18_00810 [Gordonia soli NBRC 108243]